jgi:peroxiredoxin
MNDTLEGRRVPDVTFHVHDGDTWTEVESGPLFDGRTVVLFALPGAFTPTCSSRHLPGYEALAPEIRAHGVDAIYCLSVNDSFVMNAWKEALGIREVAVLPDGNGEFTAALGMHSDRRANGFGDRSRRYALLVRGGVIDKAFVEERRSDGSESYGVSDAEAMLAHLSGTV